MLEPAILTLVAWPPGLEPNAGIHWLERLGVADAQSLSHLLRHQPPTILGVFDPATAASIAHEIRKNTGDAMLAKPSDLTAIPATPVRDLRVEPGRIILTPWRDAEPTVLPTHDIQTLVRASLQDTRATTVPPEPQPPDQPTLIREPWEAPPPTRKTTRTTRELLDIHTADKQLFRLDGDKFGYTALGQLRAHADPVNMNRMLELLDHLAPDAAADEFFTLFNPPPWARRFRPAAGPRTQPVFDFYSRWTADVYRHILTTPA